MRQRDYAGRDRGCYERPKENGWKCHVWATDPNERFNCAGCGREITAREGQASTLVFPEVGDRGLLLCVECFDKEVEGRRKWIANDQWRPDKENAG